MVKKDALLVYLQRRLFLLFYRATALQRGNSFPSCAWRISQLHRAFSLTFALDFLDLTTFLRQQLLVYTTAGTVSGRFILDIYFLHEPFQRYGCRYS